VNKQVVLSTLVHRAKAICDSNSLPQELKFLRDTFQNNSYSKWQILWALNPPKRAPPQCTEGPTSVAFLPIVNTTFKHISRVLSKHNIKTVSLLSKKLSSLLQPIKDDLGLKTRGAYSIHCKCVMYTLDKLDV
jgi:hypothetical protein